MSVYKKLQSARVELLKSDIKKTGLNKHSGYKYFELDDFLPKTQIIFNKIGLCGVVSFSDDLASLTLVDVDDNSETCITCPVNKVDLKGGANDMQKQGAMMTYVRRYLWTTALELVENDTIDQQMAIASTEPKQAYTIERAKEVIPKWVEKGADPTQVIKSLREKNFELSEEVELYIKARLTLPKLNTKGDVMALFDSLPETLQTELEQFFNAKLASVS